MRIPVFKFLQDKDLSIKENYGCMKSRDVVIAIIALVLAYYIIGILWSLIFSFMKIAVILIAAYILYLFLKKLL